MADPGEGRETLGFLAAAFSGPVVLGAILGLTRGFTPDSLTMTLGALLFGTVPGVLLGLPVYYSVRKVRVPGRWWTTAFGAAVSAAPVTALMAMGVGMPPGITELGRLTVTATVAGGALACGAIGGFMFWTMVFKGAVVAQRS